jgi:hypothetical protein
MYNNKSRAFIIAMSIHKCHIILIQSLCSVDAGQLDTRKMTETPYVRIGEYKVEGTAYTITAPIHVLATTPPSGGSSVDPIKASALLANRIAMTSYS